VIERPRVSRRLRGAGARLALMDVVLLNVDGLSVPVPHQALYDAASEIRLATEGCVRAQDCVSAVEIVLAAMQRAGVLCFCLSERDIESLKDSPL
jgi:hypothetical protein